MQNQYQSRTRLILTQYKTASILHSMKMKYTYILTAIFSLSSSIALAQPKKVLADKIVAVVGNKVVLKSDIDNSLIDMQRQGIEVPADARCLTLEQSMGIKALVLQAEKDSLPVTDEDVKADIDNQI